MDNQITTIYHGSQEIIKTPEYGKGKAYNDYGRGFYCTESIDLAKEWACPVRKNGYANIYTLNTEGLNIMHLTKGRFNILNWIAILLRNRAFDIDSPVSRQAKDYLLENYLPDTSKADILIGYRADDSYFSYAQDFINNAISVRELNYAMQLGQLGEQIVLVSKKAFGQIEFKGYDIADYREFYFRRARRDEDARNKYSDRRKDAVVLKSDLFVMDMIRNGIKQNDSRLQSTILE